MDTKSTGKMGEDLACEHLVKNGYKILGRNWDINFGEIDIIAKKKGLFVDKTIHFVEVKTLSGNTSFYPEDHVNSKKLAKYKRLAEVWLDKNKFHQDYPHQIDVVSVSIKNGSPEISCFENVVASDNKKY